MKWQSHVKYALISGIFFWIAATLYIQANPNDDYYINEFSLVLLRKAPPSSKVVARSSSLFSLRNEYCAYSRIELSPQDYSNLLAEIDADRRFIPGERKMEEVVDGRHIIKIQSFVWETVDQKIVWEHAKHIHEKSSFVRQVPSDKSQHFSLLFLIDEKHVEVNSCRT